MYFVLVTAMLSMQWSTTHIHLAEHHNHDESHHQHNIEVHAHQLLTQNDNFVDSIHKIDEHKTNVVELDNDCNIHKWNNLNDQLSALTLVAIQPSFIPQSDSVEIPGFSKSKRRYIDYSTIHLRAPPKFS